MDDKKIIELYNFRSETALVETKRKYGRLVGFLIYQLLHNRLDVEECENDTYLGAWNTIPPKKPANLKGYILKIARNQALKKYEYLHAEKRNIEKNLSYEELNECLGDTTEFVDALSLREDINAFLDNLQKSHRQVFMLRYWYFMSVKEIEACCGMSKSKVETILFRTRNKLKTYLLERSYL